MKTGKSGCIVRRKAGKKKLPYFYLQLNHNGSRKIKVIQDESGVSVTTKEDAEKHRQRTADEIIFELTGQGDLPLTKIYDTYLEFLPNYQKKGRRHIDATKSAPIAPATLTFNKNALEMFIEFLEKKYKSAQKLSDITPDTAKLFIASLRKDSKESSANRYLMGLRNIFDVLPQTSERNPFKEVQPANMETVKDDTTKKERFEIDELKTIIEKARLRNDWIYPAVAIGYATGFRLGDVLSLRWKHIDKDGLINYETRKARKEVEQYRPELLPILTEWRATFQNGVQEEDFIFPEQAKLYHKDRSAPVKIFQKFLSKTCEIVTTNNAKETIKGFHSFRVSSATYDKIAGRTLDEIKLKLAHSSEKTTSGYIQLTPEERKKQLAEGYKPSSVFNALMGDPVHNAGGTDTQPAQSTDTLENRVKQAVSLIQSADIPADLQSKIIELLKI